MGMIQPDGLATHLKRGQLDPIYLLFGDEELLIDEAVATILEQAVDNATRSFNFDRLDGAEATSRDVVERSVALPVMAERRTLFVRNIDKIIGNRKTDDGSGLFDLFASPPESTVLIMTASTSSFLGKGRSKPRPPYDAIIRSGTAVHFKKLYDREYPSWTAERIRSLGKKIEPEALEIFVTYAGGSLRTMKNEIDKLMSYVEERVEITADDVRSVVGLSKQWNVFELQKAIGQRNLKGSVEIIERMITAGEPAPVVLTMLTRYFTILWRALDARRTYGGKNEMARALGVPSFFLDEYLAASKRYGIRDISGAFSTLLAADIALKTSGGEPLGTMSTAVSAIVRGVAAVNGDPRLVERMQLRRSA